MEEYLNKKRILTTLCALAIVMAGSVPALTAGADESGQSASYYPISVEEYTYGDFDELRINKVYQLSQMPVLQGEKTVPHFVCRDCITTDSECRTGRSQRVGYQIHQPIHVLRSVALT